MVVHSADVQEILRSIIKYYPGQKLSGKKITIADPYYVLYHYHKELEEKVHELSQPSPLTNGTPIVDTGDKSVVLSPKAAEDLHHLVDFIKRSKMMKKMESEKMRYAQHPPKCTFDMLWMLYKPGTQVYSERNGELDGFIVKSIEPWNSNNGVSVTYKLTMWALDFNGSYMCRVRKIKYISWFDGEMDVTSLQTFPIHLEIGSQSVALRPARWDQLIKRGRKYWEFLKKGCVQVDYDGKLLSGTTYRVSVSCITTSATILST